VRLLFEEIANGLFGSAQDGRGERFADFGLGEAILAGLRLAGGSTCCTRGLAGGSICSTSGEHPSEGVGEAARGKVDGGQTPEGGADGRAESSEDRGEMVFERGE
jgi:hypothetical protein